MAKLCKFPNNKCFDRYMSYSKGKLYCRLKEWKKKKGVCPYDKNIHSVTKINNKIDPQQKSLNEVLENG